MVNMMNKDKDRLLITGISGLLGMNLGHYFKDKYEVMGLYYSHPVALDGIFTEKCDMTNLENIKDIIAHFKPSIIIHGASLTNIDQCEVEQDLTNQINVLATRNLAESVFDDPRIIYLSSDSVYDGKRGHYSEDDYDSMQPRNHYGSSKLAGEAEVLKKSNSLILRTNIFGWNIQNKMSLGEWILEELKAKREINCFNDVFFSSIYTFELARVIDIALKHHLRGVYNCGSSDSCSKYEFAMKIAEYFDLEKTLIRPISIDEFNFRAERGKNLTLNVSKLQRAIHYKLPTIIQSVEAFYRDYKSGLPDKMKSGNLCTTGTKLIPYGRQSIFYDDIQSVVNILRSDRITQGPTVEAFEKALSGYCNAAYGVAMNSGTSALHAACLAADIGPGDEVITSPVTFVASANCVIYCSAKPVFADIDPTTYNIDPVEIGKKINSRTKAVIPVHFAGRSCDMESIYSIVKNAEQKYGHKIFIMEDACHALGSYYKDHKVGSGHYSDMTIMSFHPVKHITTGEGGIVLTNDESLFKRLKRVRSHGITGMPDEFINTELAFQPGGGDDNSLANPWYYEQIDLGYNYRITDIQSALGVSQLKKLDMFRMRRHSIVNKYNAAFRNTEFITSPFEDSNCNTNFHLYILLFDFLKMNIDRARFMLKLQSKGIQSQVHYIPVHLQPFYRKRFGTGPGDYPNAERYYQMCLSIPLFPAMSDHDVDHVINVITNAVIAE